MAEETVVKGGLFQESLYRDNKEIRKDRAESIIKEAKMVYKRMIEDHEIELEKLVIDRNNRLDMSPVNADSLILGKNFDAAAFAKKDTDITIDIEILEQRINIAKDRYKTLFGDV